MARSGLTRVAVYIDGFNLYNGLKDKHGRKYLWLDLMAVAQRLLRPRQELSVVRYFTASVRNDPLAEYRQGIYLGALRAATTIDIAIIRQSLLPPVVTDGQGTIYEQPDHWM